MNIYFFCYRRKINVFAKARFRVLLFSLWKVTFFFYDYQLSFKIFFKSGSTVHFIHFSSFFMLISEQDKWKLFIDKCDIEVRLYKQKYLTNSLNFFFKVLGINQNIIITVSFFLITELEMICSIWRLCISQIKYLYALFHTKVFSLFLNFLKIYLQNISLHW